MRAAGRHPYRLRRRRMAASEDGFTLTELLVVVTISGIIMAAIASSFIPATKAVASILMRRSRRCRRIP